MSAWQPHEGAIPDGLGAEPVAFEGAWLARRADGVVMRHLGLTPFTVSTPSGAYPTMSYIAGQLAKAVSAASSLADQLRGAPSPDTEVPILLGQLQDALTPLPGQLTQAVAGVTSDANTVITALQAQVKALQSELQAAQSPANSSGASAGATTSTITSQSPASSTSPTTATSTPMSPGKAGAIGGGVGLVVGAIGGFLAGKAAKP